MAKKVDQTKNEKNSERELNKAIELHQSGDYEQADLLYQKVLDSNPENANALHFYGLLHFHRGEMQQATQLILACIGLKPDYLDAYLNLGNVFMALESFDNAGKCYEKALELNPHHIGAATNLGVLYKYQGRLDESVALLKAVVDVSPDWGQGYLNLANTLAHLREPELALDTYLSAVDKDPLLISAYSSIIRLSYLTNQSEAAMKALKKWQDVDPDSPSAKHLLAAFSGKNVPTRASDDYVIQTFDGYAESFDSSLAKLQYQGPNILEQALAQQFGDDHRNLRILDAGCGTGLSHKILKNYAEHLIGMDISQKMLDKARLKGSYDQLICQSLEQGIAEFEDYFDLVASMDVLIYFGELERVFSVIFKAMNAGALFVFSMEQSSNDQPYSLTASGRYQHSKAYLFECLNDQGFKGIDIKPSVLRKEYGQDVAGWLVIARRLD